MTSTTNRLVPSTACAAAILAAIGLCEAPHAPAKDRAPTASLAEIAALLAGRYDNAAQVAGGQAEHPPPQHVTITIEPTPRPDWQIWRVHMDVDPDVARDAGSDTSLDAVWAMNSTQTPRGIELVPYTSKPSFDPTSMQAGAFDEAQWLSLSACALSGSFSPAKIVADAPVDEMCVAATMGLGGKRAFLPTSVTRSGDGLQLQLIYFGRPWRVEAHRSG